MIVMVVGDKYMCRHWAVMGFSQFAYAAAEIEDEPFIFNEDFDAGGIAAVTCGVRTGGWNGTADAPKTYDKAGWSSLCVKLLSFPVQ